MLILGKALPPLPAAAKAAAASLAVQDFSGLTTLRDSLATLPGKLPPSVGAGLAELRVSGPFVQFQAAVEAVLADDEARTYALVVGVPVVTFFTLMLFVLFLTPSGPKSRGKPDVVAESLAQEARAIAEGLPTDFEPDAVAAYFQKRLPEVIARQVQLALIAGGTIARIIYDANVLGPEERAARAGKRAEELVEALTRLGPAFVKIGQALSIRPDFLPAPYPEYLARLQDGVEPFDSTVAVAILEEELGCKVEDVFADRKAFDAPIASASLGQVYRTTLLPLEADEDPLEVAIKVQRPGLLESCTLDLIVIRRILRLLAQIAGPESRVGRNALSTVQVVDVYGARFIDELDYEREARATDRLGEDLAGVDIVSDVVKVPDVLRASRHVLVTEWIRGQKITAIDTSDPKEKERVTNYISVLLNVYLAQLLDTGFLHSDPHPGNFLLLEDGRIGILDCGLMTEITKEQQNAMIKYVSHLSSKQFGKTLEDLVALGFLDPELSQNEENRKIVAPIIAEVLSQLSKGGGTAAFERMDRSSVDSVGEELRELGKKFPLQIPPYFALIIRAFSTLEGLGLQMDPDYSIVDACFPYLCRRLLGPATNEDRQLQEALETFLYGDAVELMATPPPLDVEKLDDLLDGYRSFKGRSAVIPDAASQAKQARLAQQLLGEVFGEDGSYIEELLVSEGVRLTDAVTREAVHAVAATLASAPLSPLKPLERFTKPTEDDEAAAAVAKRLSQLARQLSDGPTTPLGNMQARLQSVLPPRLRDSAVAALTLELLPAVLAAAASQRSSPRPTAPAAPGLALRDVAPPLQRVGRKYVDRLRQRARDRLAADLDAQRAERDVGRSRGTEV